MWAAAILLCVAACNQIYGLDKTSVAPLDVPPDADTHLDEDIDGVPNDKDNCPGVSNTDQADTSDTLHVPAFPADGVGDACDPNDSGTHALFATYFFNGTDDQNKFSAMPAGGVTFRDGYVDIVATSDTILQALTAPMYARGELTVEAGFEIVDHEPGAKVGVFMDGYDMHRAYVSLGAAETSLVTTETPFPDPCVAPACGIKPIAQLPGRVVVQLRAEAKKMDGLKGILAGTGVDIHSDATGAKTNVFGVFVKGAHVRLLHIALYKLN